MRNEFDFSWISKKSLWKFVFLVGIITGSSDKPWSDLQETELRNDQSLFHYLCSMLGLNKQYLKSIVTQLRYLAQSVGQVRLQTGHPVNDQHPKHKGTGETQPHYNAACSCS